MADKYCDHGSYAAYAATPVWGAPQDGDGVGTTASTAASTVSIDLSTAVFTSGSSTISIMGATALPVTASANSATNIQYSATLTTMIDNIVTVINTLATAAIVNKPGGWQAPQIRNTVFARRTGNSLELMTRTGSSSWNGMVAITFANVTNASSGSWAGGLSGCWGYAFNPVATIWASSVAIGGYGVWAAALPYAGILVPGDIVKVRSNKTITLLTNPALTVTMATMGSPGLPIRFDIDDGSVWAADGTNPVFKITATVTYNNGYGWGPSATTYAHIKAVQYESGARNLVLEAVGNGPVTPAVSLRYGGPVRFDNLHLSCPGTPTASPGPISTCYPQLIGVPVSTHGAYTTFYNLRTDSPGQPPAGSSYTLIYQANNSTYKVNFISCEFHLTAAQTAWSSGVVSAWTGGSPNRHIFDSCKFYGFVSGSKLQFSIAPSAEQSALFKNCDLGNITIFGPNWLSNTYGDGLEAGNRGLFVTSQYGNREFYIERPGRCVVEWNSSKGRPYLNARLPDGITPWQIYAVTGTVVANFSKGASPVDLPVIRKVIPAATDVAEAVRTLRFNFLIESTLSWTKSDISIVVSYLGADGTVYAVDSYDPDSSALTSSASAWSSTTWNGQTWLPREFSVTTPTAVKEKSEISVQVMLHSAVTNDTLGVIIDPEIVIS